MTQRLFPAAGLLVAILATVIAARAWRGEQLLAEGLAAQRRGQFEAASAAYRAAGASGNADAAAERARLALLRRDWAGAAESLRQAMALAPMRGLPHVLQAEFNLNSPGVPDDAREQRVLGSCETAAALEPNQTWIERRCREIARKLPGPRRD